MNAHGSLVVAIFFSAACSSGPTRPTPDYQGQWSGSFRVDRCTPLRGDVDLFFCNGYAAGSAIPVSMMFSQNADAVTGQIIVGGAVSMTFVTVVDSQLGLPIRAFTERFPYAYDFAWRLSPPSGNQISGTVSLVRSGNAGAVGSASIDGTIVTLTR